MPLGVYLTERRKRNLSISLLVGIFILAVFHSPVGFVFIGAAIVAWMFRRSAGYAKGWKPRVF